MASLVETAVDVEIQIRREVDDSIIVSAIAKSLTADGEPIRRMSRDITALLSQARLAGITDLMADVEQKVKQLWEIP